MNYSQEISTKQLQGLSLTPEMKQSIAILQMNCTELQDFINKELTENPLLETDEATAQRSESEEMWKISGTSYFQNYSYGRTRIDSDSSDDKDYILEKSFSAERSYREILDIQFSLVSKQMTPRQIRIGSCLLDHINDDGYLFTDIEELSEQLGVTCSETESVLEIIKNFYPAGTGAESVPECLYLQLREEGNVPESYKTLLFSYLEDVVSLRTKYVERQTGISEKTQLKFLAKIRTLHPRPGSMFSPGEPVHYVVPDGQITWNENEVSIKLNNIGSPALIINPTYRKLLSDDTLSSETRDYLTEHMNRAARLLQQIEARSETISKIAGVIAEEQKDYLLGLSDSPKPLTQKQVSQKTGLHESTVSRTVRGKYFSTPRGTYELQALLRSGHGEGSQTVSVEAIYKMIRSLIEKESPERPLTDQKLADLITSALVPVARRTVAKYREVLGIPSASGRRIRIA